MRGARSTVFLFAKRGREPKNCWRRMKFTAALEKGLREKIANSLLARLNEQSEVEPFTFDDVVSGAICFWAKDETVEVADWVDKVPTADWPHVFKGPEGDFLSKVKFHVTTVKFPNEPRELNVFTHRGSSSLVRSAGLMAVFDVAKHEFKPAGDIYQFDHRPDFIVWGDWVFIFQHQRFESLTNIRVVTSDRAEAALDTFEKKSDLTIADLKNLKAAIAKRPQLARRLAGASHQGILEMQVAEKLVKRIEKKKLSVPYKKVRGVYHFAPDSNDAKQVTDFVNLLVDYFLHSPSSDLEYRAPSKFKD